MMPTALRFVALAALLACATSQMSMGPEEEEMLEAIGVMTKGEPFPLVSSASIRKATFQLFS